MHKPNKFLYQLLAFALVVGINVSCEKDEAVEPVNPTPTPETEEPDLRLETNNWIYDVMKEVYLWEDELPAAPNFEQEPEEFYNDLLSSKDRFSYIIADYQELMNSLNGVSREAGYEFMLSRSGEDNVVAIVLYVKKDSPAQAAGLKRGDVITSINGQTITMSNYQDLIAAAGENHTVDYRRFNETKNAYEAQAGVSLAAVELSENPNYLDTVYVAPNGKKVGYFVYNFFSPGVGNTSEYDQEMDNIIADFKSKGVNELVLDLRYNSGGAVSSAANLASLVGQNVNSSKVFYENRWNQLYQDYISSRADGDDILRGKFLTKDVTIGNDLASGTIYVLVGSRTASASELIINGLRPYMNVVVIGEQTVGKNVGSIPIEDEENPDNHYGLLPIVFQIYNSQGQSDYANGFTPDAGSEIDEFSLFPFKQLGDINEPLLARALELISGEGARISTKAARNLDPMTPIMSSIDKKTRTNRLILDKAPQL
ncbi:S41 family peptidase [Cesiribacter sp. SM1]|uniref:S41 family peptidase n=1 Tax=Cesiribacter sp. SM1 TaxID=2861196 RepID=UPI001CD4ECA9|nr:S41 family peptidase [Cesiribacter sp. SM1]